MRTKVKTTNYVKQFDTFEEGYLELTKLVPELKVYTGETAIHDEVIKHILNTISTNIPSVNNPNYPNTLSFSIESHEVGLKTDCNLAFGWKVAFNREKGATVYKFRVTFITIPTSRSSIIEDLKENGWVQPTSLRKPRRQFKQHKVVTAPTKEEEHKHEVVSDINTSYTNKECDLDTTAVPNEKPVNVVMKEAFDKAAEESDIDAEVKEFVSKEYDLDTTVK